MCGFFAVIRPHGEYENDPTINNRCMQMLQLLKNRGPDYQGFRAFGRVILGSTRLNVINQDKDSDMPFISLCGKAAIVFNGMIYNHKELRDELQNAGMHFRSSSDTEVILNAYLLYGPGFEKKLRGMWGFTIYDFERDKVVISRDRFGIKPVYQLILKNNWYIYSSEIKPLLEWLPVDYQRKNFLIIDQFLARGYLDHSPDTFYNSVTRLLPSQVFISTMQFSQRDTIALETN